MTKKERSARGLPTKEALRQFVSDNPNPVNKRDIARAFGVKGQERTQLRVLLREMAAEGMIEQTKGNSYTPPDALPRTGMIEIIGLDGDGEMRAKPVPWHGRGPVPIIYVLDKRRSEGYLEQGTQVLAELKRVEKNAYEARVIKQAKPETTAVVGVFTSIKGGGRVTPTDKKIREEFFIPQDFIPKDVENGDLVVVEPAPPGPKTPRSKNPARIAERLGGKDDPRLISLIAIHSHGIPTVFPKAALKEAEGMTEPDLSGGRVDIRDLPLVTIDGEDARDFDDAVHAEPDDNGGWKLTVAIADVSHYVTPGSALDKMAFERGNSTYFSDRVVPMLPEKLSNDLCSLRPKVNRACLAVHMWIDKDAQLKKFRFFRGLMRSAARLTYEQVEDAHRGAPDETTGPLVETVIKPLYKAYSLLKHAREKRGALEIDLPERKAVIDEKGQVTAIVPRKRLESHQLIEEFMILANVAAAEALRDKPCMYRIHPAPAYDKLETTRDFLKEFGYSLPRGDQLRPENINRILKLSAEKPDKELIHTVLLRTQSQASYSPDNIGHFGLALTEYAHFTSPIRRYADLVVHRALVKYGNLGKGGLTPEETEGLEDIAEHISVTERRSMIAERDVTDRFTAQYLSANIGKDFKGRISGVTRFGLFVTLDESGADGIVPMRSLPGDFYIHDEKRHALVGKRSGREYRLASPVVVILREADPLRGSTVFELLDGATDAPRGGGRRNPGRDNRLGKDKGSPHRGKGPRREKNKKRKKR